MRYAWQLGTRKSARAKRVFGKPFARRATVTRRLRAGRTHHVRLTVAREGEKHSQTVVVRVPRSAPR